jgi:hypothetical protein
MSLERYTISTTAGMNYVDLPITVTEAMFSNLLKVSREGMVYDIVIATPPTDRQVRYKAISKRLTFLTPFNAGEKINVLLNTLE